MTPSISILASEQGRAQALSVSEAAEQRHSIRKYQPTPVPEQDLREIVRLAGLAPSAFNVQPWRFVVVQDPDLKGGLHEAAFRQAQVASAPAVMVLYTDMADTLANLDEVMHPGLPAERRDASKAHILSSFAAKSPAEQETWAAAQGHIALGYVVLAAQSLGYATSVMAGFEADKVKDLLGLPSHVSIPALVAVGVADEAGFPTHRHGLERILSVR